MHRPLLLAALGISILINASPVAFNAMKIVGALYLLWLAWQAIRGGSMLAVDEDGAKGDPPFWPTFLTGLMVNLSNPKVVLFFITFLPGFVDAPIRMRRESCFSSGSTLSASMCRCRC